MMVAPPTLLVFYKACASENAIVYQHALDAGFITCSRERRKIPPLSYDWTRLCRGGE
jgi:hypothetical protein